MVSDADYGKYLDVLESMLDYDYFDMVCHLELPKTYGTHPSPAAVGRFGEILKKIHWLKAFTADAFVKSSWLVMPDLIRHPEHIEITG